jgi:SAM-dependent methyltransferase
MREGIPDFILEELSRSADPVLRRMRFIDRMAPIYESRLWYPIVLNICGGLHSPSLARLISTVTQKVQSTQGRVLDVACGPSTYGRRIASPSKEVFGIDVSLGMLRQGATYIAEEGNSHMHFARARVEALPFKDEFFDAALCCGSLHLFADTVIALREIARVMKPEPFFQSLFRRRSRWRPEVSQRPGVESQEPRPSCIRASSDGTVLERFRLPRFPARNVWLHLDVQRSQEISLIVAARPGRRRRSHGLHQLLRGREPCRRIRHT